MWSNTGDQALAANPWSMDQERAGPEAGQPGDQVQPSYDGPAGGHVAQLFDGCWQWRELPGP